MNHDVTIRARASALYIVRSPDASTIPRGRTLPRRAGVSSIAQWRRCKSIVDTTRIVVLAWLFPCRGVARPTRHASTSLVAATSASRLRLLCLHLWFSCNSDGLSTCSPGPGSLFHTRRTTCNNRTEHMTITLALHDPYAVQQHVVFAAHRVEVSKVPSQCFSITARCYRVYAMRIRCARVCRYCTWLQ